MSLAIGEIRLVQGSAKEPYKVKNVDGNIWSCGCPGWRNSPGPVETKTCKHVKALRDSTITAAPIPQLTVKAQRPSTSKASVQASETPVLLAHSWDGVMDPKGFFLSEKLDGCRAWWTGSEFLSRQGNRFFAPDWFRAQMPSHLLDGELFLDRGKFSQTISIIKRQDGSGDWTKIRYMVFDAPHLKVSFEERMDFLKQKAQKIHTWPFHLQIVDQEVCTGIEHLQSELTRIEALGGEGLMLRQPGSFYEAGRSQTLLKVKNMFDTEARVINYTPGKGKFKGMLGALQCETLAATLTIGGKQVEVPAGIRFDCGTGLTDQDRRNPPSIGKIITYRFQELSSDMVPRFPAYLATRDYE